jgi:hypothetical protein
MYASGSYDMLTWNSCQSLFPYGVSNKGILKAKTRG